MCGRYYIDPEAVREVEKLVNEIDASLKVKAQRDVHPSEDALVICGNSRGLLAEKMRWGFPMHTGKGLLINARAESAAERKTFRDSVMNRRCVIPAAGFYEWDRQKEKVTFYREDSPVIYLAGCYSRYEDRECFVILTTEANPSVAEVHGRMPLILDGEEVGRWIGDAGWTEQALGKTPVLLENRRGYEQMRLEDLI
ncbi:SOS response-associated peptidase [Cuneatibacter caecimuris]|uniref:Abasic site processing protein n=1 Tax=Cuneatibacter caecimuris TaxID=1796618 RepID=A0A4V2F5X3_9FIRM|nr:SOS response-associated peptidase [Cuneatibacter caecimuris]RZS94319.1 putative SOS response-associated peptidase YedK [Cuneatibacter caecimuris]